MTKTFLPLVSGAQEVRRTVCARNLKGGNFLNVATYNIGYNYDPEAWVMAAEDRIANIGGQAAGRDVEVFCLQEVMNRGEREELLGFRDFFKGWDFYSVPHNSNNHYANAIFSSFPIVKGSERAHTIVSPQGRNDRVNLSAQVLTPAGVVRVFNIHTRFEEAGEGTRQIMAWVREVTGDEPDVPFFLCGDWNTGRKKVQEIAKEKGLRLSATSVGRIDHILAHGLEIEEECTEPRPSVPGEHDPIFATLRVPQGGG